jgi:hypothetical protein
MRDIDEFRRTPRAAFNLRIESDDNARTCQPGWASRPPLLYK